MITSAHWIGDPRLNRHVTYLEQAGHVVSVRSTRSESRGGSLIRALRLIASSPSEIVMLPDPELFVPGSAIARVTRKRPIIDIHEDYPKTAAARAWVPTWLVRPVSMAAAVIIVVGRWLAWRTLVAAPELVRPGDVLVANIPAPGSIPVAPETHDQVVYVGDVTVARGAAELAELADMLDPDLKVVVIGQVAAEANLIVTRSKIVATGRLGHDEAWKRAAGSVAGLSLLHPVPAYREAVATKLWEYMAAGIPPVVSDLSGQRRVVGAIEPALVCSDVESAAIIIRRLRDESALRAEIVTKAAGALQEAWDRIRPDLAIQGAIEP